MKQNFYENVYLKIEWLVESWIRFNKEYVSGRTLFHLSWKRTYQLVVYIYNPITYTFINTMTEAEALVKKNNCSSLRIDFFFSFLSAIDLFCSRKRRSNVYNKYFMNVLFLSLVSWDLMVILFFLTNFKKNVFKYLFFQLL